MIRSVEEILASILETFPEAPLDPKGALAESGRTYLDWGDFVRSSHGRSWRDLGWQFLKFHGEAVHFVSPQGLAAYLPAYLRAALEHFDEVDMLPRFVASALTRRPGEEQRFDDLV